MEFKTAKEKIIKISKKIISYHIFKHYKFLDWFKQFLKSKISIEHIENQKNTQIKKFVDKYISARTKWFDCVHGVFFELILNDRKNIIALLPLINIFKKLPKNKFLIKIYILHNILIIFENLSNWDDTDKNNVLNFFQTNNKTQMVNELNIIYNNNKFSNNSKDIIAKLIIRKPTIMKQFVENFINLGNNNKNKKCIII